MLHEYTSLRQESMGAINNRVTVANFTFGAIAVVLAALIAQRKPGVTTGAVAVLFVPQLAKVGLMIWLGEYNRSQRAGKWIAELEARINALVGAGKAMAWESTLLGTSVHMTYPYVSVVLLLLGSGWASIAVGTSIILQGRGHLALAWPWWPVALGSALVVLVAEILFIRMFRAKWGKIKRDYSRNGPAMMPL
jgi:hypothetical protein